MSIIVGVILFILLYSFMNTARINVKAEGILMYLVILGLMVFLMVR